MADVKLVIRVHFVDDSFKTLAVSSQVTATELCDVVADKIELEERDTFGLYFLKGGEYRSIEADERPCQLMIYETAGLQADVKKYLDRNEWEKLKKEWEKDSKLVYKRRVFIKNQLPTSKIHFIHYNYLQAVADVKDGTYPCNKTEALELAGLQLQNSYGDYDPKIHVSGFLKDKTNVFGNLIPEPLLKSENTKLEEWESLIYQEHAKLNTMKKEDAKIAYLLRVRQWSYYGGSFWVVNNHLAKENGMPESVVLSVNQNGIEVLQVGTKENLRRFDHRDVTSWTYNNNSFGFTLCVVDGAPKKYRFITPHGRDIVKTLQAYSNVLSKLRQ
jgi:hypothetical protein